MVKSTDLVKDLISTIAGESQEKLVDDLIEKVTQDVGLSASEAKHLREEILQRVRFIPKPTSADNLQDYLNKVASACETCVNSKKYPKKT